MSIIGLFISGYYHILDFLQDNLVHGTIHYAGFRKNRSTVLEMALIIVEDLFEIFYMDLSSMYYDTFNMFCDQFS